MFCGRDVFMDENWMPIPDERIRKEDRREGLRIGRSIICFDCFAELKRALGGGN